MFIVKATRLVPSTMGTGRKTNLKMQGYVTRDGDNYTPEEKDAEKYSEERAETIAQAWQAVGWETEILPAQ